MFISTVTAPNLAKGAEVVAQSDGSADSCPQCFDGQTDHKHLIEPAKGTWLAFALPEPVSVGQVNLISKRFGTYRSKLELIISLL